MAFADDPAAVDHHIAHDASGRAENRRIEQIGWVGMDDLAAARPGRQMDGTAGSATGAAARAAATGASAPAAPAAAAAMACLQEPHSMA